MATSTPRGSRDRVLIHSASPDVVARAATPYDQGCAWPPRSARAVGPPASNCRPPARRSWLTGPAASRTRPAPGLARQGPHTAAHHSMRTAARLSEIDPRDRRSLGNHAADPHARELLASHWPGR